MMFFVKPEPKQPSPSSFTDEQYYVLDTVGVYHYKKFLSDSEVEYCNSVIEPWIAKSATPPHKFSFFMLDPIFCEIMARKWIVEACLRTCGPWFRLDHCVGIQQPGMIQSAKNGNWVAQDHEKGNLHGGPRASQGSIYFNNFGNNAWSGHMSFGISLIGQSEEDGGFCYIPGSHKQSSTEAGPDIFSKLLNRDFTHQCIHRVTLEPGDAVFFPESIVHGTTPLKKGKKRRALYYKYVPGYLGWRKPEETVKYLQMATTNLQRSILKPPYVASFHDDEPIMSDNFYREKTCDQ